MTPPASREGLLDTVADALKPFALNVGAVSLSGALGHISREHLLAARDALTAIEQLRDATQTPPKAECEYCKKWHDPRIACPEYAAVSSPNPREAKP